MGGSHCEGAEEDCGEYMESCWLSVLAAGWLSRLACEKQICQAFSLDKKNHLEQRDLIKDFLKASENEHF